MKDKCNMSMSYRIIVIKIKYLQHQKAISINCIKTVANNNNHRNLVVSKEMDL